MTSAGAAYWARFWVWLLSALAVSHVASAAGRLELSGPSTVVGDGKTEITLRLETHGAVRSSAELVVTTSGGTVRAIESASGDSYRVHFVPPQVAAPATVELRVATQPAGPKASLRIEVEPPAFVEQERATEGPLDLRVPTQMLVGSTPRSLSAKVPVGRTVRFSASAGTLGPMRRTGERASVELSPPAEKFPRQVIVAAISDDGELLDWTAFPLIAAPEVKVRSGRGTSVSVGVGQAVYGPFQAGPNGETALRVHAPPGLDSVEAIARDLSGAEQRSRIALSPPRFERLLVLCPTASDRLTALAVRRDGRPVEDAQIAFGPSLGDASPAERGAPGVYSSFLTLPPTAQEGERLEVSARDSRDPALRGRCEGKLEGEGAVALSIAVDRLEFRADSPTPVQVRVKVQYPGRRPARPASVELTAPWGTLRELPSEDSGERRAEWLLPARFGSHQTAVVRARLRGSAQGISAQSEIRLRPGPAARLGLSTSRSWARASGRDQLVISATPTDAAGNPVLDVRLHALARGQVGPFERRGAAWVATYQPPARSGTDSVVVTDTQGGARAETRVRVMGASGSIELFAHGGYTSNLGKVSGPLVFAGAGARLPLLEGRMVIAGSAGYYRSDSTGADSQAMENVDVNVQALPLLARAVIDLASGTVQPFAGLEAGLVVARLSVASPSTGARVKQSVGPAVSLIAGAGTPVGPGSIRLEGRYLYAPVAEDIFSGNLAGLAITAGYQLEL